MRNRALLTECRALIRFYDARGWDWTDVVGFTIARAGGRIPLGLQHPCCIHARRRKERQKSQEG